MYRGIIFALLSALLFGITTPLSKTLLNQIHPITLAGLLYFGSGIGLLIWFALRILIFQNQKNPLPILNKKDIPWLLGVIVSGGIIAPIFLMFGLSITPASIASLLLNMESVLTALLAWIVFKENVDRRIFIGMLLIVTAGMLLSWEQSTVMIGIPWGTLAILVACLMWAVDNNITCKISTNDAVQIAGIKGLTAGIVNLLIAQYFNVSFPEIETALLTCVIGFLGYGLSLVLFVLALRHLGTARTGAYFSIAPFIGAIISFFILNETPNTVFLMSTGFLIAGIFLHLSEKHEHEHTHDSVFHTHNHYHDLHHQHEHDFPWDEKKSHNHSHKHDNLTHSHLHFPDIHHKHHH